MASDPKFKWSVAVCLVLAAALTVQGYLLWQTRQDLAALAPPAPEAESLTPLEEKILARLDEQEPQITFPDAWNSSLLGGDPFQRMQQMQDRINRLFSASAAAAGNTMSFSLQSPDFELRETETDYRLLVKVPQEHEIDLQTEVEDRVVRVNGKVSANLSRNGSGLASQIISSSQFSRRFDLPGEVDEIGVYTEQDTDGLVVVIPKANPGSPA